MGNVPLGMQLRYLGNGMINSYGGMKNEKNNSSFFILYIIFNDK